MYEFIILQRLMETPMHGYLIAKIINDIIGPFAKVSNGRLYPLLTKLETEGLIEASDSQPSWQQSPPSDRRSRPYRITDAGRKRFHHLMMDTTSTPGDYSKLFWLKVQSFDDVQPVERLYLVDHYVNYCQTHIFHLKNEMEDLAKLNTERHFMRPERLEATLYTMQHYLDSWQLELDSGRRLRARVTAGAEGLPVDAIDAIHAGDAGDAGDA